MYKNFGTKSSFSLGQTKEYPVIKLDLEKKNYLFQINSTFLSPKCLFEEKTC